MVLLTFTGNSVKKIVALQKSATTRYDTPHWWNVVDKIDALGVPGRYHEPLIAHIYAGSPRNGGIKIGEAPLMEGRKKVFGADFSDRMVGLDGFKHKVDLASRLQSHYTTAAYRRLQAARTGSASRTLAWFEERRWVWVAWDPQRFEFADRHDDKLIAQLTRGRGR